MSFNVDKYKDIHESEEHWQLRKAFLLKWADNYSEERLLCLAKVYVNIELMGCRYPPEVMKEVAQLAKDVVNDYRNLRKNKLKRTFVSASDAAEDRAKGVRREAGNVIDEPQKKSAKIDFVPQGHQPDEPELIAIARTVLDIQDIKNTSETCDIDDYLSGMMKVKCIDVEQFNDDMFFSEFGNLVLLIRPWVGKFGNIKASCQVCNAKLDSTFENGGFSLVINGTLVAQATGLSKVDAKSTVETMAWNRLRESVISVVVKQQWIAQGDGRISVSDVSGERHAEFGTPVETSVASKMMKMMGWKGGGLGPAANGIAEPIKPNFQMVNRAGLGSSALSDVELRKAAQKLMRRYLQSDTLDVDLVFSSEFDKNERATLHLCAQKMGLASKSYGADKDRFLVVRKKIDPFSLAKLVIEKGGNTPKYQVFIPESLAKREIR